MFPAYHIEEVQIQDLNQLQKIAAQTFELTYAWGTPTAAIQHYLEHNL